MPNVFITSDQHLTHQNMYTFVNFDGSKVRPWDSAAEADEVMRDRWNATVRPEDKVYCLGDWSISKRGIAFAELLNGTKILIRGNHDIFRLRDYAPYFKDVRGLHKLGDYILSHVPLHPDAITNRWCKGNVHGHSHNNQIMVEREADSGIGSYIERVPDPRYINVCVERTNYTPVAFEEILRANHR